MEVIGIGLSALGEALTALCISGCITALVAMLLIWDLISTDKITLEQFKDFIAKKDRWHR